MSRVKKETHPVSGKRILRSEQEREMETREYIFEEQDALAIPQAVRDRFSEKGLALRWIRVSLEDKDDYNNVGKRQREGWTFVEAKDVPEMETNSFVRESGRYSGAVCRGDLALAMMPAAKAASRQEFYENRAAEMMDAVHAQLEQHNSSKMPIKNSSRSSVTVGRAPQFQD